VSGDKVCTVCDTVDDYHDHIVAMSLRKLNNGVRTHDIPSICWSLCEVKLSIGSMVLQLSLIA
jgi:hypothetical protein